MRFFKTFPVLLLIFLVLTTSGAFATWMYATVPADAQEAEIAFGMDLFHWEGAEELPDDEEAGEAHMNLIDAIVNGEGISLNSEESYLNDQIQFRKNRYGRDTLGSMAITQGNKLEEIFDLTTENISFLIYFPNDYEYYIFTTSVDLGENGAPTYPIGSVIAPIYRTTVVNNNGTWVATKTEVGSAESAYYEESQYIFITRSKIPSFDPESWEATPDN